MADPVGAEVLAGLRRLRSARRRYWAASLAGVPAIAALGFVLAVAGIRGGVLPAVLTGALAIGWLSLANHLERRVASAHCPRCGGPFCERPPGAPRPLFTRRGIYPRRCQQCGLGLNGRDHGAPGWAPASLAAHGAPGAPADDRTVATLRSPAAARP